MADLNGSVVSSYIKAPALEDPTVNELLSYVRYMALSSFKAIGLTLFIIVKGIFNLVRPVPKKNISGQIAVVNFLIFCGEVH